MLLDKIISVSDLIVDCEELRYKERRLQEFEELNNLIQSKKDIIKNYLNTLKFLNQYDSNVFDIPELLGHPKSIESILYTLNSAAVLPKGSFVFIFKDIENKTVNLKDKWKLYVENKTADVKKTLRAISGLVEDKTKINSIIIDLNNASVRLPSKQSDLDQFEKLLNSAELFVKDIGADKEVETFLFRVVNQKATIEDLTPNVLEWIKKKDYTNKLFIQLKQ